MPTYLVLAQISQHIRMHGMGIKFANSKSNPRAELRFAVERSYGLEAGAKWRLLHPFSLPHKEGLRTNPYLCISEQYYFLNIDVDVNALSYILVVSLYQR